MNIDSFYTNGKLHGHKGEDYALHGEDYFIICDGCSSAKNSDLTARLQAHVAEKFINTLKYNRNYILTAQCIGNKVKNIFNTMNMFDVIPLATLIIGFFSEDKLRVVVYGDGSIIYKNKDFEIDILNIEYSSNAPFYPFHYTNEQHYINLNNTMFPTSIKRIFSSVNDNSSVTQQLEEPFAINFDISELEYLYIFSDGISEFTGPNGKLPIEETVKAFTSMKNTNGVFIERRCKRQLKIYEKERIFPQDDFSMAGIYL